MELEGDKIVSSQEMERIETLAVAEGASPLAFMQSAGREIALLTASFLKHHSLPSHVYLFVGKGNNGGDAYATGVELLRQGCTVTAYHFYPLAECTPLCCKTNQLFAKEGGHIDYVVPETELSFSGRGVILDGLTGTGFRGTPDRTLTCAIRSANHSGLNIIAIDIPSGIDGNTGQVHSVAIHADLTIYLGLPKIGFFLQDGYNYVGALQKADFGLPIQYVVQAKARARLARTLLPPSLPRLERNCHKYQRGYVLGYGGSTDMPGAALMACRAAMRAGAGIVRLFYQKEAEHALQSAPWELVRTLVTHADITGIVREAERAHSIFVGPGIGRGAASQQLLTSLLPQIQIPCVIDADALAHFSVFSRNPLPQYTVLTPHKGELFHLIGGAPEDFLVNAHTFAKDKQITLLCKGAPNFLFHPDTDPLVLPVGNPGMATAGTGDILTGIIAAFLAVGLSPREATAVAVQVHGRAGDMAVAQKGLRSVVATDLLDALPHAMQ